MSAKTIYLKDYTEPAFFIPHTDLMFYINDETVVVKSTLVIKRNHNNKQPDLILDGFELETTNVLIDGKNLVKSQYSIGKKLHVFNVPDKFKLTTIVKIYPHKNTQLEGLYLSQKTLCTQCEAEGFRAITWFLDRPDVLSIFSVAISADPKKYPVLLSNGNLAHNKIKDGRRIIQFIDPFAKPCYLFALVAGDLSVIRDIFTTKSGKKIYLSIYVEHHNKEKCAHAMSSLQKAMSWDEKQYGLEYDLENYNIVAVDSFNSGAMENKGLNIFNSKYVLADDKQATDNDLQNIESVIAHEYFHNWTGNRVTCRDWFQLSLKEGLTVYRDQCFSADMGSTNLQRVRDIAGLRNFQFPEDASALSHAVRPESYQEIRNFYTATVYEKGAELIRMLATMLGKKGFRSGMDLYFSSYDGKAVTCDDFINSMADANNFDLQQFKLWYSQIGTPTVKITSAYDKKQQKIIIHTEQAINYPQNKHNKAMLIPMRIALIDKNGKTIKLDDKNNKEQVLNIKQSSQDFVINDITHKPALSLFRQFSAPVKFIYDYSDDERLLLLQKDDDGFNRCEQSQQLAKKLILHPDNAALFKKYCLALKNILHDENVTEAMRAELLYMPTESDIYQSLETIDVDLIFNNRKLLYQKIAKELEHDLMCYYQKLQDKKYQTDFKSMGRRELKNICLFYLSSIQSNQSMVTEQFETSNNMTDTLSSLRTACFWQNKNCQIMLDKFEKKWQNNSLVMDNYFAISASCYDGDIITRIKKLQNKTTYNRTNPNKIYNLLGSFAANSQGFCQKNGAGFEFLVNEIVKIDKFNEQVAARIATKFKIYSKYDKNRQAKVKKELQKIMNSEPSDSLAEIVQKILKT
ncbi:MAG: aminopeptidase N [Gammaproteobacteria bacterium]|nr:MAG: aminopeptidase N [Gammaproteobacteria bacterium]